MQGRWERKPALPTHGARPCGMRGRVWSVRLGGGARRCEFELLPWAAALARTDARQSSTGEPEREVSLSI